MPVPPADLISAAGRLPADGRVPVTDPITAPINVSGLSVSPPSVSGPTEGPSTADTSGDQGSGNDLHKAPKALAWSFLNGLVSRVGTVGIGIALARLLGPSEFGTYAVAYVALMAVLSFNELGISLAIVRWPGDPKAIAPTINTLSLISSSILAGAVVAVAPWFSAAMGEPKATLVVQLLGLSIVVSGAVAAPAALMQREFRQGSRLIIDQVSVWSGALVSIGLAVLHAGAMSLAIGRLVGVVASGVLFIMWSPTKYRVGLDRALIRPLLKFGLPLAGASVLVFAMGYADQLVVGKMLGPIALGFYVLAFNLSSWPVNLFSLPLRNVAPPAFSRLQTQPAAMRSTFVLVIRLLMALTLPLCLVIAGAAGPIVEFVYGKVWAPAASVLAWLAVLAAFKIIFELTYDFLVVLKASGRILMLQIASVVTVIPALIVGARLDGMVGVAIGQVAVAGLLVFPLYLSQLKHFGFSVITLLGRMVLPAVVSAAAGFAAYFLSRAISSPFFASVAAGVITLAAAGLMLMRDRKTISALRAVVGGGPDAVSDIDKDAGETQRLNPLTDFGAIAERQGPGIERQGPGIEQGPAVGLNARAAV